MHDPTLKITWDRVSSYIFEKEQAERIGMKIGAQKAASEIAKQMKNDSSLSIDIIAKVTKLSIEEIERL